MKNVRLYTGTDVSEKLKDKKYKFLQSDGENGTLSKDKIKLIIATYHVLFSNEAAIQNVYSLVNVIKKTSLYQRNVKLKINDIYDKADKYSRKVNNTFMLDKGKHKPENLVMFADMNDYLDNITLPVIENTRLAIRLALSKGVDKAVKQGAMAVDKVDTELLSHAILAADMCHIATEVHKAELIRAQNLCGGVINNIQPYNLSVLETSCKSFTRLLCREMNIDGVAISEDQDISAWIKNLCKKMCSVRNIVDAMKVHDQDICDEEVQAS